MEIMVAERTERKDNKQKEYREKGGILSGIRKKGQNTDHFQM
jgi:hypothetical protein